MCGRYRLTAKERWLAEFFNLDPEDVDWAARWNVAPTQDVATIRQDRNEPVRKFGLMRWGLIPSWAKDDSIGVKAINAMAETAAEKPFFREAIRKRRCLIPADGFYEWKLIGPKKKQPYNIGLRDSGLFAFAGLWERWKNPKGMELETCTILTTDANSLVKDVHNRMPVILRPEDYDLWLDSGVADPEQVADLLKPFDARMMRKYPVSPAVSSVANDGPECGEEIAVPEHSGQIKLF